MKNPARVFVLVGVYPGKRPAETDQKTVMKLHASDMVGKFETAVITRDEHGQVHVTKRESNSRTWAEGGLVVGAVLGAIFPPSILLTAGAGAVLGGFGASANGLELKGIPAKDLDSLGQSITPGEAALVVVGEESARQAIEYAKLAPIRQEVMTGTGTYAELEQAVLAAVEARQGDAPSS